MKKYFITIFVVALIIATGFGIWTVTKPQAQEGSDGPRGRDDSSRPLTVKVAAVERQAAPLVLETVGTVEAEHSVEVRPQVTGMLHEVSFEEGQQVEEGQLLFTIDPATYEAAVRQAEATLARDRAQTGQARAQLERLAPLAEQEYITREELDQARLAANAAAATEAAVLAQLQQARIQLDYSRVYAPISGRTGALTVKSGNVVNPGDTAPLVTINRIQPVMVRFTLPQQNMDALRRYQRAGEMRVEILREDKVEPLLGQGPLVFIDNNVNAETGTVLLKARIPNETENLLPGQFVAVRLVLTTEADAVVIPEVALQQGQDGAYVYLVDAGKVRVQPITVARQLGDLMVIAAGLAGGEQLIIEHPRNIAADMSVEIAGAGRATAAVTPAP